MPLPWKKTKPNRISRIVADLQPPSRVVETGFPTSVVDLFVKNRDRIKRHSLKKTKHKHFPLHLSESVAPPPTPSLSPDNSPRLPADEAVLVAATLDDLQHNSTPADDVIGHKNQNANANANANSNANFAVFVLAAKMFLAVVPVLSTRKLALGITLSAFLLFLLEILGQFVARFFNPSSIRNRLFSTTITNAAAEEEQEFPLINSASNNEIQIVESNSDCEQLGLGEGLQREPFGNREKGMGCCSSDLEVENEEEGKFEMGKNQRSKSSKLRAKIIKKLIPKKLRSGNGTRLKKKKNEKNKMKQEGGIMIMENEQGTESSCEEEEQEVWEVQQIWEPQEEEIGSSTMGKAEEEEEEEEDEDQRKKNWEFKMVIVMILLGLCGGRFLAVVLTVSGCFIFKFIKFVYQKWKFG